MKNAPLTISIPHELKQWIAARHRYKQHMSRSEVVAEIIEAARAEEGALGARLRMSEVIDALQVMVFAWDRMHEMHPDTFVNSSLTFPLMPRKIRSVQAAIDLLKSLTTQEESP